MWAVTDENCIHGFLLASNSRTEVKNIKQAAWSWTFLIIWYDFATWETLVITILIFSATSGRNMQDVWLTIKSSIPLPIRLDLIVLRYSLILLHFLLMILPCELVHWPNSKHSIEKPIGRVTSAHWWRSNLLYLPVGADGWRWKRNENTALTQVLIGEKHPQTSVSGFMIEF